MGFPWAAAAQAGTGLASPIISTINANNARNYNQTYDQLGWIQNQALWHQQNQYNEGQLRDQRAYDLMMWNRQNQYNESIWRQQNEYNSPIQQMARFKEAGLNPALIYGQMNGGMPSMASAQMPSGGRVTSGSGRGVDHSDYVQPNIDFVSPISAIYDLQAKQVGIENQRKLGRKLEADIVNTVLNSDIIRSNSKLRSAVAENAEMLATYSLDAAEANAFKAKEEATIASHKKQMTPEMLATQLAYLKAQISMIPDRRAQVQADTILKQITAEVQKSGTNNLPQFLLRQIVPKLKNLGLSLE